MQRSAWWESQHAKVLAADWNLGDAVRNGEFFQSKVRRKYLSNSINRKMEMSFIKQNKDKFNEWKMLTFQ